MTTFTALSRKLGWGLISVGIIVLFGTVTWLFWSDAPAVIIALGVWIVAVVLIWGRLWHAVDYCRLDSRSDVWRRAAVKAVPLAISFAPAFVVPSPVVAFPLPASLALPLLITDALLGSAPGWGLFYQFAIAVTSLCTVWLVCFYVIIRGSSKRRTRRRVESPHSAQCSYEY